MILLNGFLLKVQGAAVNTNSGWPSSRSQAVGHPAKSLPRQQAAQAHPDPAGSLDVVVLLRTQDRGTTDHRRPVKEVTVKLRNQGAARSFQTGVKINFNI
jgi:hypothetical protein